MNAAAQIIDPVKGRRLEPIRRPYSVELKFANVNADRSIIVWAFSKINAIWCAAEATRGMDCYLGDVTRVAKSGR